MVFVSSEKFFEESDNVDDADINWNMLNLAWTSGDKYFVGIQKSHDNKEEEFEKFVKVHWKHSYFDLQKLEKSIRLMTTIHSSMTVHFLLKAILWMKVTMKRA